jgi:hypothetical protein
MVYSHHKCGVEKPRITTTSSTDGTKMQTYNDRHGSQYLEIEGDYISSQERESS